MEIKYGTEVKDKNGRSIYLTNERYEHIKKHPETRHPDMLGIIEQTIKNPHTVRDYFLDPNIRYYYSYHNDRKSKAKYLRLIVKYLNGEGFIITAYFVANI